MQGVWGVQLLLYATLLETLLTIFKLPTVVVQGAIIPPYETINATSLPPDLPKTQILPDNIQIGCKELRAKRYISDGYCTSIKPIREVVCAGQCFPLKEQNLPWWTEFTKYWAKTKLKEWRCEEAVIRRKDVQLMCENGETRTYNIKVVKSCRCKQYVPCHNKSLTCAENKENVRKRPKRNNPNKKGNRKRQRHKGKRDKKRRKNRRKDRRRKSKKSKADDLLNDSTPLLNGLQME